MDGAVHQIAECGDNVTVACQAGLSGKCMGYNEYFQMGAPSRFLVTGMPMRLILDAHFERLDCGQSFMNRQDQFGSVHEGNRNRVTGRVNRAVPCKMV